MEFLFVAGMLVVFLLAAMLGGSAVDWLISKFGWNDGL